MSFQPIARSVRAAHLVVGTWLTRFLQLSPSAWVWWITQIDYGDVVHKEMQRDLVRQRLLRRVSRFMLLDPTGGSTTLISQLIDGCIAAVSVTETVEHLRLEGEDPHPRLVRDYVRGSVRLLVPGDPNDDTPDRVVTNTSWFKDADYNIDLDVTYVDRVWANAAINSESPCWHQTNVVFVDPDSHYLLSNRRHPRDPQGVIKT